VTSPSAAHAALLASPLLLLQILQCQSRLTGGDLDPLFQLLSSVVGAHPSKHLMALIFVPAYVSVSRSLSLNVNVHTHTHIYILQYIYIVSILGLGSYPSIWDYLSGTWILRFLSWLESELPLPRIAVEPSVIQMAITLW
jgi:hypothetical protein